MNSDNENAIAAYFFFLEAQSAGRVIAGY